MYRGDRFFGYGIVVGGLLIDGQVSTVVEDAPNEVPKVIATFNLSSEHSENQPRIDIDNPSASNEFQIIIYPDKTLTVEQLKELRETVKGFLTKLASPLRARGLVKANTGPGQFSVLNATSCCVEFRQVPVSGWLLASRIGVNRSMVWASWYTRT